LLNERNGDFTTGSASLLGYNRAEPPQMQESRELRRGKLAEEIARKRRSLSVMIMPDGLPLPARERRARLIEQMTEELQKMEAEYHELNVEQIREELKRGQSGS
jgi:hypothetical protein